MKIPVYVCPRCGWTTVIRWEHCMECRTEMLKRQSSPLGEILSFTTLNFPPEGFETPLSFVLVRLKRGMIVTRAESDSWLKIGGKVELIRKGNLFFAVPSSGWPRFFKKIFG
ncbi:MAG TPA: hypothetical protein VJC03_08055 [bacterium]|nr:hypothetical protein [bacterium]